MSTISVEVAFKALLLGSAAVVALIADRMAPHMQSQGTPRPFIVYSRISGDHQRHLLAASGLVFVRMQLDLFGDTPLSLYTLAEAVRQRLDGYKGTVTVGSDSLVVQNVELIDEQSSSLTPDDGSDQAPHRYRMDFRISAAEPIPSLT